MPSARLATCRSVPPIWKFVTIASSLIRFGPAEVCVFIAEALSGCRSIAPHRPIFQKCPRPQFKRDQRPKLKPKVLSRVVPGCQVFNVLRVEDAAPPAAFAQYQFPDVRPEFAPEPIV